MIQLENVSKKLDRQPIIHSVSFRVPAGSFHTLLGDSGTGKTTLLKLIAGLVLPDEGTISLMGRDVTHVPAEERKIPMIFQQPLLFPHLTVFENIAFGLETGKHGKKTIRENVQALMEVLQIAPLSNRYPGTLSGGQQQRVSMARALAPGNSLVLMDEPFSSLDPSLRREMGQLVKTLQREMNLTVIFVTHDVTEALQLSDEIILLKEGRVLETGTPQQLYEKPKKVETAQFMEAGNLVEGMVTQGVFQCELGSFPAEEVGEGAAVGLLPEHQIHLAAGFHSGKVLEIRYLGKSRQVKVVVCSMPLWVEDRSPEPMVVGQGVKIKLPDRMHLISREHVPSKAEGQKT